MSARTSQPEARRPRRTRRSAEERRRELVAAAVSEFAVKGLHGTATEAIARRAGISHAYLFRLFPTKKDLFIACAHECLERVLHMFESACAGDTPEERLESMGHAYEEMLADRELLRSQMQLYAACADPEIRAVAREGFERLCTAVGELSGADGEQLRSFFATGMLLNVAAAMDAPELGKPGTWE
jgi:AcrR family transcriptional regulator